MNFRIFNDSFHNFFLSTVTYRCVEIAQRLKDKIIIYSSLFKPLHEREGGGGVVAWQRHTPSIFCLAQLFKNLNY